MTLRCKLGFHSRPDVDYNSGVECARGCGYVFPTPTHGLVTLPRPDPKLTHADLPPVGGLPPSAKHELEYEQARLARAQADALDNEKRRS